MCKLRLLGIMGTLALSVAATGSHAQTPNTPMCYALQVAPWQPAIGGDSIFHRLPTTIRLDTLMWPNGGRHLEPQLAYPYDHAYPATPRWEARGDTVRLLWSNGFAPTRVTLVRRDDALIGEAVAESDAVPRDGPPPPRAAVTARRVACRSH